MMNNLEKILKITNHIINRKEIQTRATCACRALGHQLTQNKSWRRSASLLTAPNSWQVWSYLTRAGTAPTPASFSRPATFVPHLQSSRTVSKQLRHLVKRDKDRFCLQVKFD